MELPVIVDSGDIDLQGCNTPWPVEVTTSWSDNCGVNGETSGTLYGVAGDVVTNGCTQ
ncbi:hypothetical protein NHF50_02475 [Flavobacterium sp. NRK F10]|uniref:hypothetical protein n=1 Tax=Flavobacterium sp. NRK F10 TaxID=2954931 RepID=UPI00209036B7|nr:hypothetical protein [Flavobacterium sp. NRK F10]MCO6173906.1 hypothetical protein [Flavobacterium sp. NRK F10]